MKSPSPDAGPSDEERGQPPVPVRLSLARSSSTVNFALGIPMKYSLTFTVLCLVTFLACGSSRRSETPPASLTIVGADGRRFTTPNGRLLGPVEQLYWNLTPETASKPAVLKDNDHHLASGGYSHHDLEQVLSLVGRIPDVQHVVYRAIFFEGVAARVELFGHIFLCTKDRDGAWSVVGGRELVY